MSLQSSYKAIIFLALTAITGYGCHSASTAPEKAKNTDTTQQHATEITLTAQQYAGAGITTGPAVEKEISSIVKASGVLDVPPQNMVTISVPYGGLVKYTSMLQGMYVHKGAVLATLENAEYIQLQQDYAEAVHQLVYLRSEEQRQQELRQDNINAAKTYQKATADYQVMKIRAESLRQKLLLIGINPANAVNGKITGTVDITTPIDGYVTKVMVNRGKYVQANDVLFELADTRHTHCELSVFEKDIPRIQIGDKVIFRLANETTDRIAEVHLAGKEIREDRTVQVHCHMEQEDPSLLPGSFITASIQTHPVKVTALPDAALVQGPGTHYIFLQERKDNANVTHFRMVPVQTGNSSDGLTQVILPDGISPAASFVTKGAYILYGKINNSGDEEE